MKTTLRILGFLILFLLVAAASGLLYFNSAYPVKIPVVSDKIERTPEHLARGKYLADHVVGCLDCHSDRDFRYYAGPIIPGSEGKGGMKFDQALVQVPGTIYSRNITPSGIGSWTDGELIRAVTTGINKKGEALFPLMPYQHYAGLCKEDLMSILAYIRQLPAIDNRIPERSLDFPMNLIIKTIPAPDTISVALPDSSDKINYGRYLVNAVGCIDCHSQKEKGQIIPGLEYAGGFAFHFPNGDVIRSANITPDDETGIGKLSEAAFVGKFKSFVDSLDRPMYIPIKEHQKNTVMPWTVLGGMSQTDLRAIYTFLRTLPPVKNKVEVFTPASAL